MKKTIFRLLLFAGLFLLYDRLFLVVAYYSAEAEADKRLEYIVQGEINKEIVVVGSSRGARGINACQIEDQTGLSAYNLCYPGSNIEFHEFIVRTLLRHNSKPELLILVIDDDTGFKVTDNIIFRKDRLYPLVKYKPIWKEMADLDNGSYLLSSVLVMNRMNKYNFDLRKKTFTPKDTIFDCGSMLISWQARTEDRYLSKEEQVYSKDDEVNSYVNAYEKIVEICQKENIELLILFPPLLRNHSQSFENRVRALSNDQVEFFVYNAQNPIYSNEEFFHDGGHLLTAGATIFTQELVQYLNRKFITE